MKQFTNLPITRFPADTMLLTHFLLETKFCWVFNDTPKHKPVFDYLTAQDALAEPDAIYPDPAFYVVATLPDFCGLLRNMRQENLIEQLYNTCADPLLLNVRYMGTSLLRQQSYIRKAPFAETQYSWSFPRSYFNNLLGLPMDYVLPKTTLDEFIHYVMCLVVYYGHDIRKHAPALWECMGYVHTMDNKTQQMVMGWLDATAAMQDMLSVTGKRTDAC